MKSVHVDSVLSGTVCFWLSLINVLALKVWRSSGNIAVAAQKIGVFQGLPHLGAVYHALNLERPGI